MSIPICYKKVSFPRTSTVRCSPIQFNKSMPLMMALMTPAWFSVDSDRYISASTWEIGFVTPTWPRPVLMRIFLGECECLTNRSTHGLLTQNPTHGPSVLPSALKSMKRWLLT